MSELALGALPWRIGTRVPQHVYDAGDKPLATLPTAELAQLVVTGANDAAHEREWALMREDRDQFERRALAAEAELRETASALEMARARVEEAIVDEQRSAAHIERLQACLLDARKAFIREAAGRFQAARRWLAGQVHSRTSDSPSHRRMVASCGKLILSTMASVDQCRRLLGL